MNQAPDRTELLADLVEKILHGLPVPHVHGVIADLGTRGPDPFEVAPDLALRLNQAEPFIENLGCTWAFGMVPDRPPDLGLVAQSGQPAGFSLRCGRTTQQNQPGPERSGKCRRHFGRDPTRSSADDHDVARAERKGARAWPSPGESTVTSSTQFVPAAVSPTSAGPRHCISSAIRCAAASREPKSGSRSMALHSSSGHSCRAVLARPARAPEAGSTVAASPASPNDPSSRETVRKIDAVREPFCRSDGASGAKQAERVLDERCMHRPRRSQDDQAREVWSRSRQRRLSQPDDANGMAASGKHRSKLLGQHRPVVRQPDLAAVWQPQRHAAFRVSQGNGCWCKALEPRGRLGR